MISTEKLSFLDGAGLWAWPSLMVLLVSVFRS
jgi:hypothetical protein